MLAGGRRSSYYYYYNQTFKQKEILFLKLATTIFLPGLTAHLKNTLPIENKGGGGVTPWPCH
jgi:hypothetical protein